MKLVEREKLKNVVIATDQKGLLKQLNEKNLRVANIEEKNDILKNIINDINRLLNKVGDTVVFEYAQEKNYQPLYRKAHMLSSLHQNKVFNPMLESVPKNIKEKGKNEQNKVIKNTLVIRYTGKEKSKNCFELTIDGKLKKYTDNMNTPVKSMFNILRNVTSRRSEVALKVEAIPNFEKYMKSQNDIKWMNSMYKKIKNKCVSLNVEDDFERYFVS